jgi:hypothetical protein
MSLGRRQGATDAFLVALPPWALARVVVLVSLALARYLVSHLRPAAAGAAFRAHQGLLGWDAGFYQAIAAHGYGPLHREALRFFPLLPLAARLLADASPLSPGGAVVALANASALVAGALVWRLALMETSDHALARRAAWLLALVPPAYVLVMGYSEGLLLVTALGAFWALRTRRWGLAAAFGYLGGLTRPVGVLLALPAAIEAWRAAGPHHRFRGMSRRLAAVAAPVAGATTYLGWVGATYGDPWLPLSLQQSPSRRGGLANPLHTVAHNASGLLHGHVGSALHVPWVVGLVLLALACFRRWPASYAWFAAANLAVALTAANLDSVERYALSGFPLVLTGAALTSQPRVERAVLVACGAALVGYSLLAFLNASVP